jgi:hypothetical protein
LAYRRYGDDGLNPSLVRRSRANLCLYLLHPLLPQATQSRRHHADDEPISVDKPLAVSIFCRPPIYPNPASLLDADNPNKSLPSRPSPPTHGPLQPPDKLMKSPNIGTRHASLPNGGIDLACHLFYARAWTIRLLRLPAKPLLPGDTDRLRLGVFWAWAPHMK